ncbi:hypothetical protein KY308_01335, partial [Candidatus Woesearchaeota archaeon]|nr:hypothetical protein [Candidatus Woesearchaeota archaeon]
GAIEKNGKFIVKVDKEEFEIKKEHLMVEREVSPHLAEGEFRSGFIYLNKDRTADLEAEGFAREITRRIQAFRKEKGLIKTDLVDLFIKADKDLKEMLSKWKSQIKEKVGASGIKIDSATSENYDCAKKEKVKDKEFEIMMSKI